MKRKIENFFKLWKKTAIRIANFQTKLILSIVYFILLFPYFICHNLTKNLLHKKGLPISSWIDIPKKKITLDDLRKQF